MRSPAVAGMFYEKNPERLKNELKECFFSVFGPGKLNDIKDKIKDDDINKINNKKENNKIISCAIAPHAGYVFSGSCAAHSFNKIASKKIPKTFVIIGPNHYGHTSGLCSEDWNTPLGIVKTDLSLVHEIRDKTSLEIDNSCHIKEHSIEVELPFLKFLGIKSMIAAISLGQDIDPIMFGKELFPVIIKKDVGLIISSDFTHYGYNYGYVPFIKNIKKNIYELDKKAIEHILNFDIYGFKKYIEETRITICGYAPILTLLSLIEGINKKKSRLLKYYTSGDILGDYSSSVSYASIFIEAKKD